MFHHPPSLPKMFQKTSSGFTLIELLVVIAIIGLLASVVLVSLNNARIKARDAKRLTDMRQIQTALDLYYQKNGQYPNAACDPLGNCGSATCGGWDSSGDGEFIIALKNDKVLSISPADPRNSGGACGGTYGYRYYRYGADPGETAILAAAKLFLYLGSIPRNRLPAYIQIVLAGRAMQEIGRENLAGLWVGVNRLFMV